MLAGNIETAFGRALLAALGHETGRMRPGPHREGDHLLGRRHLEIERLGDVRLEARDVLVADVPAILAQMRGDAVGARFDRDLRRTHGIGMPPAARVTDGRDVVDVDAEAEVWRRWHAWSNILARSPRRNPLSGTQWTTGARDRTDRGTRLSRVLFAQYQLVSTPKNFDLLPAKADFLWQADCLAIPPIEQPGGRHSILLDVRNLIRRSYDTTR